MNLRLVSKLLGYVAMLIGGTMLVSLPWAHPALGMRHGFGDTDVFETRGFLSLLASIVVSLVVGVGLLQFGRRADGRLYRKEAMAIVGLSWVLATVLGAMPYYFTGVQYIAKVRLQGPNEAPLLRAKGAFLPGLVNWVEMPKLDDEAYQVVETLVEHKGLGLDEEQLIELSNVHDAGELLQGLVADPRWRHVLIFPGDDPDAAPDRAMNYRVRWQRMGIADALFESQSGFSTTGATIIGNLEDPTHVPHCILFWRSGTHFLGGLGIIVLFVVVLGQGSAGKALMRAEMPGPTKEGATARMQHTAWLFAVIYCVLNVVLTLLLWIYGMSLFDALCHAFGTMATGGFSTYDSSVKHFSLSAEYPGALIDYTITFFMILAGTNFTLLYLVCIGQGLTLLKDIEWRTYMAAMLGVTAIVMGFGLWHGDFTDFLEALRHGLFQVVAIMTTTGFGTHDFNEWNSFGRGVLFLLMFVGGCAGSTGGGMKVIRHILFLKILRLEVEQAYHPSVVRPLRLGGKPVEAQELRKNILVYFGLILVLFVFSWLIIVTTEPDSTWGGTIEHKLIDSATGVAATLNNIGPGLGTVGATQNYGHFSWHSKLWFVWLMMLGRLEIFPILVLVSPRFWRAR